MTSSTQKCCVEPVFRRHRSSALMTRLDESSGMVSSEHTRTSRDPVDLANFMSSPKSMTWKRDARSWYPSSRLRTTLRKRLTLDGEKYSTASAGTASEAAAAMTTTRRDDDDDAIEPGDRSATRRAVLPARAHAARVGAPRDADAESVAVGIARLSVAGGDRWATTRSGPDAGSRGNFYHIQTRRISLVGRSGRNPAQFLTARHSHETARLRLTSSRELLSFPRRALLPSALFSPAELEGLSMADDDDETETLFVVRRASGSHTPTLEPSRVLTDSRTLDSNRRPRRTSTSS